MKGSTLAWTIMLLVAFSLCGCFTFLESFRGGRGGGGRGRGGGGRGRGGGGRGRGGGGRGGGGRGRGGGGRGRGGGGFGRGGRGFGGGGYLSRFRRRNQWGPRRNIGWWDSSWYSNWNYPWASYWSVPCVCKKGCTLDGCPYPGNGIDECVWASDCNCC